jgi:small subunit ribosomal protein S8
MNTNDPISDMLTRIRNAQALNKFKVEVPLTKVNFEIAKILKHYKFIKDVRKIDNDEFGMLEVDLMKDRINEIQRVSKPGKRIFSEVAALNIHYKYGKGIVIVSTSKGIMSSINAKKENVGGEVMCQVW